MASNKKTTEPIFSNGTEAMWFIDRNCQYCQKYTQYNEKLGRMPSYKCAVQRDIELQECGIDEVSQRSYDACQSGVCPFFKDKDGDTSSKHTEVGHHVAPKAEKKIVLSENVINIREQAEKSVREREAEVEAMAQAEREKGVKAQRNKEVDNALAKAFDRRMSREAIAPRPTEKMITPQLQEHFAKKGKRMKAELDAILRVHLSSFHVIIQGMLDIGDGIMQDCIREIKARKRYKHALKHQVNKAVEAHKKVMSRLLMITDDVAELRNIVLDNLTDLTESDVTKLTYSLKAVLDKYKIPDSMFIAQVDTAWCLFELARKQSEFLYETARMQCIDVFRRERLQMPPNFLSEFDAFFIGKRPDGIAKEWQKVSELIHPSIREVADEISEDKNVTLAVNIIHRKLSDVERIEEMSNDIIAENPHTVAEYLAKHPDWNMTVAV